MASLFLDPHDDQPVKNSSLFTNEDRRATERKVWRGALVASLVLHLLIGFVWRDDTLPVSPFAAAGPRAGDPQAAGGSMEAVELRAPPPEASIPPVVPVPAIVPPDPVDLDPDPEVDHSLTADAPGSAEAPPGPDEGPGVEGGEGRGDGGSGEEGLFRITPPTPRGMIMPPSNRSLRGREVEVWVFVNENGRVVPDSTRLEPPTPDRDFNRRLIREAAQWVFEPARRGGIAVAAWFPYTISM